MRGKSGRRWGELRGEYAEVRLLASALRDIADGRGATLRVLEARMPYGHSVISQNLSGAKRPAWGFVLAFLDACTGNDRQSRAVVEPRVRRLWEAAAPGKAQPVADGPVLAGDVVPAELRSWVVALRDAAAAQQVVARVQLSVGRHHALVDGLMRMLSQLTDATEALTAERDSLAAQLRERADLARELADTHMLLADTQQRLDAAARLQAETSRRLDEALRQREQAERLMHDAVTQAGSARRRLAELEQHAIAMASRAAEELAAQENLTYTLMGHDDQDAAEQILRHVDDTLEEEAVNLDQLRSEIGAPVSARSSAGGLPGGQTADNAPASPANAVRGRTRAYAIGQAVWAATPTGHIAEDWPEGIQPDDRLRAQQHWRDSLRSGTEFELRYRASTPAGAKRYYSLRAVPVEQDGKIIEWAVNSTDITNHWQPEEGQGRADGRFRASPAMLPAGDQPPGASQDTVPQPGQGSAAIPDGTAQQSSAGQIITFYSYKGGTGRTTALANIAWILAANGRRVLVTDWNLEAPGLHRLFRPFLEDDAIQRQPGLVAMINEYAAAMLHENGVQDGSDYAQIGNRPLTLQWAFPNGGRLDYLSPGAQDREYWIQASSLNWDNFYDKLGGGRFFREVRADMKRCYDNVLIDSAAGFSDIADICTIELPDVLILCFTPSAPSIEGAAEVARQIQGRYKDRKIRIFPVPMLVDPREVIRNRDGRTIAMTQFTGFPSGMPESELPKYWSAVEVPHRISYSPHETLAVFDPPGNPASLLSSFERITAYITDGAVTMFPPMDEQLRNQTKRQFSTKRPGE
jgi:CobQ/CobB/MinD/ParA nucleotide binding domain/PAS fold